MAKKQNGFEGSSKSFGFKPVNKGTDFSSKSFGSYPKNRSFGSTVSRTVIEHYDMNSDWASWRKGFEYYSQAAWAELFVYNELTQEYEVAEINSKLYQGTADEVAVKFTGYKFATQHSDTANHYVLKREIVDPVDTMRIVSVLNDPVKYSKQKENKEIWCKGVSGPNVGILANMIGDRLTDGTDEATLSWVLNSNAEPALYLGKTSPGDKKDLRIVIDPIPGLEPFELVGKLVFVSDFLKDVALDQASITEIDDGVAADGFDYFSVTLGETGVANDISFYERTDDLPLSLYDLARLDKFYETTGDYILNNKYYYQKNKYFRFFREGMYFDGQYILDRVSAIQYAIPPFEVANIRPIDGKWEIVANQFNHSLKLLAPTNDDDGFVVFTDYSFTHRYEKDGKTRLYTDVDPWMDEVFTSGQPLQPAVLYSCSCPAHSHAILRAPQITEGGNTRRTNRQRRYPMPTSQGKNMYDNASLGQAAGIIESWETRLHQTGYKQCKHSIASLFIDGISTVEPSTYPSAESRVKFQEKLDKEMQGVTARFEESYRRGGITALEIIYAMSQGLNLDDVELTYLLMDSKL